ncbi:GlsB/YeaQ/YmgE family stress response membrane protein [Nocardia salmonicida]|uniref:GlsB/YeaQ/YmgE family stress response membrane protein n=1 Tax=Nocardia salmonicida TaxID=53431 RepID=UPI002659C428|nr:GlsB/YeaQ/YmgE family stress response membrane protein [Nocardia sp. PE-7]WKG11732.1 GlsB/YeaQ/YmgE family stress response membrane protein [Nocardia sp. PE-7]
MLGLGILGCIIIGGLAGWIADKIIKTDAPQGILLNIVVGVVGGLLGGFLLELLGVDVEGGGLRFSFFNCIVGAVVPRQFGHRRPLSIAIAWPPP